MWISVRGPSSPAHTPFISLCSPTGAILGEAEEFTAGLSLSISHQQSPFKEKNQATTGDIYQSISAGELCEAGTWRGVILHWWSCAGTIPCVDTATPIQYHPPFLFFQQKWLVLCFMSVSAQRCIFFFIFWQYKAHLHPDEAAFGGCNSLWCPILGRCS